MELWDAIAAVISKLGFPIFVATFLLLRVDKTLRDILALLTELVTAVKVLARLEEEDVEDEDEDDEDSSEEGP